MATSNNVKKEAATRRGSRFIETEILTEIKKMGLSGRSIAILLSEARRLVSAQD